MLRESEMLPVRASVRVSLEELYAGAQRTLQASELDPADGRSARLRIPVGSVDGEVLPLLSSSGAPAGFAEIHVEPHPLYRVDGRDVLLDLPVAPWEVAVDTTLRIPTLAGAADVRVPAGSQDGEIIRMSGRGLPGAPPGDQLVRLCVVVPRAASPRARTLYGDLRRETRFNPRAELYRRAGVNA